MKIPTPRTDECLGGNAHGHAIEHLARDLERENAKLTAEVADLQHALLRRHREQAYEMPDYMREVLRLPTTKIRHATMDTNTQSRHPSALSVATV